MKTVALDKSKHDRKKFDCGNKLLNNYLCQMANQQAQKDNTRTFVLELEKQPNLIVGFYTLTMTTLDLSLLPDILQKKHASNLSAGLIARLAVDKKYSGKGFGQWLLINSLKKLNNASQSVAFPLIIVDAKDGAIDFYKKFGFKAFESYPNKLCVTVREVNKSLGQNEGSH